MRNLNKIYHKGKFRSGERAKHLRPFLKRQGNKRFRKTKTTLEEETFVQNIKSKRAHRRKRIRALIITRMNDGTKLSYYKNYPSLRDLKNAVKRSNVIGHTLIHNKTEMDQKSNP